MYFYFYKRKKGKEGLFDYLAEVRQKKRDQAVLVKLLVANSSYARRWWWPNGSKCNRTTITTTCKPLHAFDCLCLKVKLVLYALACCIGRTTNAADSITTAARIEIVSGAKLLFFFTYYYFAFSIIIYVLYIFYCNYNQMHNNSDNIFKIYYIYVKIVRMETKVFFSSLSLPSLLLLQFLSYT